jgi:hypothetical protein
VLAFSLLGCSLCFAVFGPPDLKRLSVLLLWSLDIWSLSFAAFGPPSFQGWAVVAVDNCCSCQAGLVLAILTVVA